jgi:CubicO group peptidase (beta-lactamase class C family)
MRRQTLCSLLALTLGCAIAQPALAERKAPPSPAIADLRFHFNDAGINVLSFQHIDQIFDSATVKAGGTPWALARAETTPAFTYAFEGKTYAFEDIFDRTFTNGLLIIKDDKIVFERYRNYSEPSTRFLSMSMAKSMTSLLVGIAYEQGKIRSLDDQIVTYVPELKGGAYDGVTIRNALLMKSGIDQGDDYQPTSDSDIARFRKALAANQAGNLDQVKLVKRAEAPGTVFRYATLNTTVLGAVVAAATKQPLATFMSENLWKPLGAEADAYWMTDGDGAPRNGMGFNAVMRDYARVGLMMLHEGKANGRQIVSAAWVKESTVPSGPEPITAKETHGYQYQWWTLPDSNAFMAIGLQGQFIYVDPDTKTVVVKLSYFPLGARGPSQEAEAFFRAASAWKP